jgi:hypothetical protein
MLFLGQSLGDVVPDLAGPDDEYAPAGWNPVAV